MSNGLNEGEVRQVEDISELCVRRYFDNYLNEVFPKQMKASREHTHLMVERHNSDKKAHGGVERKVNKYAWMIAGGAVVIGVLWRGVEFVFGGR